VIAFTQPNFRCCFPVLLVSPLEKWIAHSVGTYLF
jgi:hypothetical protein